LTFITGETGKRLYAITSQDMSTNTSLEIKAVPPSGEANTKTFVGVLETNALSNITLEDGSTVATVDANKSMYYILANVADLDEKGIWTIVGVWNDTTSTKVIKGTAFTMTVLDDMFG